MSYQDRYVKTYRPQQHVSFEAYQCIRAKELDTKVQPDTAMTKPVPQDRIHYLLIVFKSLFSARSD